MNEFYLNELQMPAAALSKKENPWPAIKPPYSIMWPVEIDGTISEEEGKFYNYKCDVGTLPYRLQDEYNRKREIRSLKVAILENNHLKATFLMEYGGRLWSLYDKDRNRELLYVNPVFQPGNLAIRDAWFSGGVEWNMGIPGHNPFTCASPFFATLKDGNTEVLRMYEWERIRSAPYQVDFYLPEDSKVLFVRVRLVNPHNYEIAAYWWSNIAVPETENLRVLAPANSAYLSSYSSNKTSISKVQIPYFRNVDISYPLNNYSSHDYFFHIPDNQRPWEAALDCNGKGLIHASTSLLKGRKLFVWGSGPGGRRWQEFLSVPSQQYVEIQAGLARTQFECIPMQPKSEIEWLEAYGYIEAEPSKVHDKDWTQACKTVEKKLEKIITLESLEQELKRTSSFARSEPDKVIQYGSGWGALEIKRMKLASCDTSFIRPLPFPEKTLGKEQEPWLSLLIDKNFPEFDISFSQSYMVQDEWFEILRSSVKKRLNDHWNSWYHLGIMHYVRRDFASAEQAWNKSISKKENAWSFRNIAILYKEQGDIPKSLSMFEKALKLIPKDLRLNVEYGNAMLAGHKMNELTVFLRDLDKKIYFDARIQLLKARLALFHEDFHRAAMIIENLEIPNLREVETSLSDIWYDAQTIRLAKSKNCPVNKKLKMKLLTEMKPPFKIDFRMSYPFEGNPV